MKLRSRFRPAVALAFLPLPFLLLPAAAGAGGRKQSPPLTAEHVHPSGAFRFRTPEGWRVAPSPTNPDAYEAGGDGVLVRFVYREGELGFDSLHADCMLERLAGPMETDPRVKYEYDFLSGVVGGRRVLDSAFVVHYDRPIQGSQDWRQRNLTLVGAGESLCVITYAPERLWKKDRATRALLDAVLASVAFPPPGGTP